MAIDCVSFSYITNALQGKSVLQVVPVAQASFGLIGTGGDRGFSLVVA